MNYNAPCPDVSHTERPVWDSASVNDVNMYKEHLNYYLLRNPLHTDLFNCKNLMCKSHNNEIIEFHDNIVSSLVKACKDSIPTSKFKSKSKVIPGWNDNVEHYFRVALFWHKLWVEKGRPDEGIFANIRRETRAEYHKARKLVIKNKGIIQSEKLAESLVNDSPNKFWKNVKKNCKSNNHLPSKVDNMQDPKNISDLFKDKFDTLFNCISYSNDDLNEVMDDIDRSINDSCSDVSNALIFSPDSVSKAIRKLKLGKHDGSLPLTSDNILHSTDILNGHLALLFSVMVRHGFSPDGMLIGTMVPLPKGRWNLSNSSNYRAITISSLFGKILDNLILEKEASNLMTNDLQFSFKPGLSTTMCSTMVRDTISYFVHKNSTVYGLVLDATKAFDRLNYCKLFKILLSRNVNPLICRLLLFMYINQTLRVRWGNTYSDSFSVSNGVKQGGVISPIFFCVYMDGLISELIASGVGCWMGSVYAGAPAYADDFKLLAPSILALNIMLDICIKYAEKYDVIFNDKSQLIVFNAINNDDPPPVIKINGKQVEAVDSITHLGHTINANIFKCDTSRCIRDFYSQSNSFLGNFSKITSKMRNYLFFKYCSSFYGSQFLPIYNDSMNDVIRAWHVVVRRVWRVPWRTHCNFLPHLAGVMPPELSFAKRAIQFSNSVINSKNKVVNMITGMGRYGKHSILGANIRHLTAKYELKCKVIDSKWKSLCQGQNEIIRVCEQIKELCFMRDTHNTGILTRLDATSIIDQLCTE